MVIQAIVAVALATGTDIGDVRLRGPVADRMDLMIRNHVDAALREAAFPHGRSQVRGRAGTQLLQRLSGRAQGGRFLLRDLHAARRLPLRRAEPLLHVHQLLQRQRSAHSSSTATRWKADAICASCAIRAGCGL